MIKNIVFTLLGLVAVIGLLGGSKAMQIGALIKAGANMVPPAPVVSSSDVESQQWENTLSAVGSLEAVQGVMITAEVPGRVTAIKFKPGISVKAGEILIQQDISSEQAQLRAAEANVALTKSNLDRSTELLAKKVTSKSEYDTAQASYKQAIAQAENIQTTIEKKTIKAPFNGRLGIRMVNLGQDLTSGDAIVSLQAVDPIFVNFYLPQQELSKLALDLAVRLSTDAVPGQTFTGKITAINPEVDPSTRNIRVQATLANKERQLLPGMFTKLDVVLPQQEDVIAVPATAVAYATFGDSVFVIEEKSDPDTGKTSLTATQQFVRLGRTKGDYVEIKAGIKAGDKVVSTGVFKLQNGSPITINNDTRPEFNLDPHPEDS